MKLERLSRNRFGRNSLILFANKAKVKSVGHFVNFYGILERNQEST